MVDCDWPGCHDEGNHQLRVDYPNGKCETADVCYEHNRMRKVDVVKSRPKAPPLPTESYTTVSCGECHQTLSESESLAVEDRKQCPECGSLQRTINWSVIERQHLGDSLCVQIVPTNEEEHTTSLEVGDSYTRDLDGWGTLIREIDKVNDHYREVIKLYDGTIISSTVRESEHPKKGNHNKGGQHARRRQRGRRPN